MHVAHFIQRYPPALGGSEAYFARLSRYLVEQGDGVTVFTSNALALEAFWSRWAATLPANESTIDGVCVRRYRMVRWPGRRYFLKPLSWLPGPLWQCLMQPCNPMCVGMWREAGRMTERFDAVHASAFPYAWPIACAYRLARRQHIPFFLTPFLHLGDPNDDADRTRRSYLAPHLAWLLRQADAVFVQTPSERRAVIATGVPETKVILQGLGVEPSECTGGDRATVRRQWGVGAEDVVVGHLANNSREKGSVDLLQALELHWQRGGTAHVVLAGPEMPNFRAFWTTFEASLRPEWRGRVRRLGRLDEAQKRDFFAGIDAFALPSRSDSFGLVLLEAWANGTPNLAYRAGGIADIIHHERDGLLVKCGDFAALAEGLDRWSRDAELRRAMGARGKARTDNEFRWADKLAVVRGVMRRCEA